MTTQADEERNPTHKLEDVEVFKVDIVGRPATGDKFMVVRSEGEEEMPKRTRRAMTKDAVEALRRSNADGKSVPVVARQEAVEVAIDGTAITGAVVRQVPRADSTTERKRKAQEKRSEKYGIEALEDKGENLSYPSGDPTTENLYGDPVNLKYPLGQEDNKIDVARANNARARFKQAFKVYSKTESRRVIHTRIVEAQLKGGANPSYNPDDKLDRLLPKEVRDKLQQSVERTEEDEPETNSEEKTRMKNLDEGIGRLEKLVERMEGVFTGALGLTATAPVASGENQDPEGKPAPEPEATPEPEQDAAPDGSPQEAPGDAEAEPGTPTPSEPETAEEAPAPAVDGQIEALGESVAGLTAVVERMGQTFEAGLTSISKTVEGLAGKVNKVERSVRSGGNAEEDGTEGPVERSDGNGSGKGLWAGVLR